MTSAPQSIAFDMAYSGPDDNMELGTSPLRQSDDVNFDDLDPMHDPSVDNSMLDEADFIDDDPDAMQADLENENEDDEMLDEASDHQPTETDYNMVEHGYVEDEEILYDEDEPDPVTISEEINDVTDLHVPEEATEEHSDGVVDIATVKSIDTTETQEKKNGNVTEETTQDDSLTNQESNEEYQTSAQLETQALVTDTPSLQATASHDFAPRSPVDDLDQPSYKVKELSTQDEHLPGLEPTNLAKATGNVDAEPNHSNNEESTVHEPSTLRPHNSVDRGDPELEEFESNTAEADTNFQSIKLMYLGEEMSLFPPSEADPTTTFFLQDGNLAHAPLDKLLFSCREVLGESLGHEDELVLDIPMLGLHIYEDSKFAANLTLSQVTEVYVTLCLNERIDPIEPLYCNLSSRVCLSTQFTYLSNAASEGKQFSEIAADYVDTPEETAEPSELPEENVNDSARPTSEAGEDINGLNESDFQEVNTAESPVAKPYYEGIAPDTQTEEGNDQQEQEDHESASQKDILASEPNQSVSEAAANQDVIDKETILESIDHDLNNDLSHNTLNGVEELQDQVYDVDDQPGSGEPDTRTDSLHDERPIDSYAADVDETHAYKEHEVQGHSTTEFERSSDEADVHAIDEDILAHLETGQDNSNHNDTEQVEPDSLKDSPLHETAGGNGLVQESVPVQAPEGVAEPELDHEYKDSNDSDAGVHNSKIVDDPDFVNEDEVSAPVTPSKSLANKRKALEDEDDLDFLDLSTPEPKRTRTSTDGVA